MTLEVIGTGFGRTGTDSMRIALEMLGFGPCHHMRAVFADENQKRAWRAAAMGVDRDWRMLLGGFRSCVDWPSAAYWPELVAAFPKARVLLTWRTPESWWASFSRTILPVIWPGDDPETVGERLIKAQVFGGKPHDREHAIAVYRANVEKVLATVPPGRLLAHRLGDGWGPLCAHLGVPVPDAPFPHANTASDFHNDEWSGPPS